MMFRLLGFIVGSVAALAIILIVLGVPDFHLTERDVDQQRFDAAVKKLKKKQQEAANVTAEVVDAAAESVDDVTHNVEVVAQKLTPDAPAQPGDNGIAPREVEEMPQHETDVVDEQSGKQQDLQWYSFWNPFHSEIAARGFVSQLEKVTGLDYRVVKVKTGVYEVAFAYADDVERHDKLAQIAAATGLDLPDS